MGYYDGPVDIPYGQLSRSTMSYRKFTIHEADLLEQIMRLRRDVRGNRFIDKPVAEEDLQKILHAALAAPSVGFSQPWRFVLIRDPATKAAVANVFNEENLKAEKLFKDERAKKYAQLKLEGITEAPINLAVLYESADTPVLGQTSMIEAGQYSTVCAIQNMWLMARALNIGMGWVSILNPSKVESLVDASSNQSLVAYLCLGHVDTFYDKPELQTLGWEKLKSLDDVVFSESLKR